MNILHHRRLVIGGLLVLMIAACRGTMQLEESDRAMVRPGRSSQNPTAP